MAGADVVASGSASCQRVRCSACAQRCVIAPGRRGLCAVRENRVCVFGPGDAEVVVTQLAPFSTSMMDRLPGLKLIANFGAGVNHIDLAAARARGIIVTNTPGVFTDDTADLAMMLILGLAVFARGTSPNQRAWARFRRNRLGHASLWLFIALLLRNCPFRVEPRESVVLALVLAGEIGGNAGLGQSLAATVIVAAVAGT